MASSGGKNPGVFVTIRESFASMEHACVKSFLARSSGNILAWLAGL
jgi:hypothetical protein